MINIFEALIRLKDDIKTWVTNNLKAIKDSQFSGDYNDLKNAPNISEDETENLVITDPYGNIIFRANPEGFETTTMTAQTVMVGGNNVMEEIQETKEDLLAHTTNEGVHVTDSDKENWNNKSDFSGNYNDLQDAPNIIENESGELAIADPEGNIIFKATNEGFETVRLVVKELIINGKNIMDLINAGGGGSYPDDSGSYPDDSGSYPDDSGSYPDESIPFVGIWTFKETLLAPDGTVSDNFSFNVDVYDGGDTILKTLDFGGMEHNGSALIYYPEDTGSGTTVYSQLYGWYPASTGDPNMDYRTVKIATEPSDETFKDWLYFNAVKQGYPDDSGSGDYPDDTGSGSYPDGCGSNDYPDDSGSYPDYTGSGSYPDDSGSGSYPDDYGSGDYPDDYGS